MRGHRCALGLLLLAGLLGTGRSQSPPDKGDTVKDRDKFLPSKKYDPLPGTAVGLLVSGVGGVMARQGREGPGDALYFSTGNGSYRSMYVPQNYRPQIGALIVKVGPKGEQTKRFDGLSVASLKTVEKWGVKSPYSLVEVEVNGGAGSPPTESFVATNIRVLEGAREFPFKTSDLIEQLKATYRSSLQSRQNEIEKAMQEARKKTLKDAKPNGRREQEDLVHVTWQPRTQQLQVNLLTVVTEGEYKFATIKQAVPVGPQQPLKIVDKQVRYGKSYGVELGMSYLVAKTGKVEQSAVLPIKSFEKTSAPPVQSSLDDRDPPGTDKR